MADIAISALPSGTPQGKDIIPGVDVADTTEAATGTTKKYIRSAVLNFYLESLGLTTYTAVRVATTTGLTVTYDNGTLGVGATLTNAGAQEALDLDGFALVVGDRVLVKNQASSLQNGLYTVTNIGSSASNWILTRATDYDEADEIIQYAVVLVDQGLTQGGILYQEVSPGPFTIGTTAITFDPFTIQSISYPVSLADGGTSASLVASSGGIFYSTATAGAILSGTATARQMLQSGASGAPSWSDATYPATTTINEILYSSAGDVVTGITAVQGGVLISNATNIPSWLANPVATGKFLQSVSGDAPIWSTASFPVSVGAINTLIRSDGTNWVVTTNATIDASDAMAGLTSLDVDNINVNGNTISSTDAAGDLILTPDTTGNLVLDGVNWPQADGAANTLLTTDGLGQSSWTTASYPSTAGATGTILRSDGTNWAVSTATFADTYAPNTLLYAIGANIISGLATANSAMLYTTSAGIPAWSASMSDGELMIGATGASPASSTLTAGTGISVVNAANGITINATGGGLAIATIAGTSQAAAVNTMYIALNAGQTTLNLPATFSVGDIIILVGSTANVGGWILTAAAADTIMYNGTATSGGGTITCSALAGQTIEIVCDVQDTSWIVVDTVNTLLTTA